MFFQELFFLKFDSSSDLDATAQTFLDKHAFFSEEYLITQSFQAKVFQIYAGIR